MINANLVETSFLKSKLKYASMCSMYNEQIEHMPSICQTMAFIYVLAVDVLADW